MPLAQLYDVGSQTEIVDNFQLYLTCAVPIIIAVFVFSWGLRVGRNEGSKKLKWLAMIPLVLGAIWGFRYFLFVRDPGYQAIGMLKRQVYLHYAAFFIQIAGIIGLLIWAALDKRASEREV